jgi:nucleoside-diphosphate-sugar epimerase
MKVLLTGATGFLGYRTLEKLVDLPHIDSIVATGRNLPKYRHINHPKVSYQLGDLQNNGFVNEISKGINIIINTASLSSPWGKRKAFEEANLQTQANLIQSAKAHHIGHFVYISSPSIYYNGKDRWNVKESDPLPLKFFNEYARTKHEAEQMLMGEFPSFVILRPRALIGRGDSIIMPRLINAFDKGRLKIIGNGNNIVDLTSVSNVVDAILLALHPRKEALNEAYNISNGEPVNLWENISKVLIKLNRELKPKKVPFALIDTIATLMELKSTTTNHKEPTLTRYGVGTLAKSFTLDISKAKELLGYQPKVNTEAAIHEFVNWYKQHESL